MVKSSVLSRRSKPSPKKNQKPKKTVKPRGRKKRNKKSPRKSNVTEKVMINELTSMSLNSQNKVINMENPEGEHSSKDLQSEKISENNKNDSIVVLDDTIVPEINDSNLNESCFIIDVNPNTDNACEKSFYKYQGVRTDERHDEVTPSSSHDTLNVDKDNKTSSDNISKDTKMISFSSTNSIDDFNASSGNESLNDYEMNETIPISSVNENQNDKLNNNSVLNKLMKRRNNSNATSKNSTWNAFKKINEEKLKKLQNNLSKSPKIKTPQNSASKQINKENLSDKNENINDSVICIDQESDSDVEFVEAFNPNEKLIELSDDNDSVVCEDINVPLPLKIPIPNIKINNNNKRKKPPKRNNNINTYRVTRQNVNNPDENDEDSSDDDDTRPASLKRKNRKQITKKKRLKPTKETAKKSKTPIEPHLLRPIVIDGCNVALGHSRVGKLSVEGLQICYDYFHSRGHDVKIFLPNHRKYHCMTTNTPLLIDMERKGIVIFTPGRKVNGKGIHSYDDRFILEYASLKGAIVISRDNYRDLYDEKEEFRETISKRLLQYTFVDDLIMFPDDPLGRTGPNLEEFLHFTPEEVEKIASTSK